MLVPDFEIPLRFGDLEEPGPAGLLGLRDELTTSDVSSRLNAAHQAESEDGAEFIVEYFSTFYYLCKQFKNVSNHVKEKGYKILFKSFKKTIPFLEGMLEDSLEAEDRERTCNVVKMLGYMFIEVAKRLQDYHCELANFEAKSKGKKTAAKTEGFMDWVEEKTEMMNLIYSFLQLPLKLLWDPPAVDEEFINMFANFCYKCLEDTSITGVTMKPFRAAIFQVLSTLIKKHLHGLSFCVKVVQLLRMNEHLVNPLAQGVVQVVNDGCNNVVREIVREMGEADEQLLSDASGARCLSQFLSTVAEAAPKAARPAVELLMAFLGRDPPALRCCALTVLGEVVEALLTKEDLEQELREQRDGHLNTLEEHIHDTNAFVRSRALQVWQKLCLAKAIPVARLHNLLELVIGRLGDKSSNVKKQAVQLIKVLLEGNPYSGQLDVKDIATQLDHKRAKLNNLLQTHKLASSSSEWPKMVQDLKEALSNVHESSMAVEGQSIEDALKAIQSLLKERNFPAASAVFNQLKAEFYKHLDVDGEDDDIETSLEVLRKIWEQTLEVPEISQDILERKETLERSVAYLEGAMEFAKQIDRALPLILTLLDSPAHTDVLEAISFFTAAFQFGFSKSGEGVRLMLDLVFSKEANIKNAVCNAYQELYFVNSAPDRKRSIDAVKNLSQLVVQLNASQMDALQEMMREWVRAGIVDNHCIQVMFERFSLKISGTTEAESWASLALIAMVGAEKPKVIRSNISVLISEGLGPRGASNLILAQYTCRALQKLASDGLKLTPDDQILMRLWRLLRGGLWSSPTNAHFVPFADEAMMLVFQLAERPDKFAEELIVDLYLGMKNGKKPVAKQHRGRVLMNNKEDDLFGLADNQTVDDEKSFEESTEAAEADMSSEAVLLRLTRFVSLLGTVAAHYVGFLENRILGELKRRNLAEYERKLKRKEGVRGDTSMVDKEELEFKRTAADDVHADHVRHLAEEDIVAGEGLLAKFIPLVQIINKQPGKFPYLPLQNAALLALGMFMQVSSKICDQNLQLLVTVTEKSQTPDKRINGLLLLWALQFRFPNVLEPWTSHMFALLKDDEPTVRRTAVRVVTHLIVNEMVKVRTHLPQLATCIVDADTVIAQSTRHFFREYSMKGNALFNDLPLLVFNLTNPNLNLEEESFRTIMRFILNLVTKDKQLELLVEKLCMNFESASTDRQCRDLAFCLTQLQYSEKALRKVLETFSHFGNKLYLAEVYEAFTTILSMAAKNQHKDKSLVDQLQALVKEYREKSCADRNICVVIPVKRCPPSVRKRGPRRRQVSSGSEQEEEAEEKPVPKSTRKRQPRQKTTSDTEPETNDSDGENFVEKKQRGKKKLVSPDSDSGERVRKLSVLKMSSTKKPRSKAHSISVKCEQDDSSERKLIRNTRKRL